MQGTQIIDIFEIPSAYDSVVCHGKIPALIDHPCGSYIEKEFIQSIVTGHLLCAGHCAEYQDTELYDHDP